MTETINNVHDIRAAVERAIRFHAVSYTHLTLPTKA